jgi:DNA-nicking Smr family endonuclease
MTGEDEESDAELFRRAMQDVQPLKSVARVAPKRRRLPARARFARLERAAVLSESLQPSAVADVQSGDELLLRRPGVPQSVIRDLRRGLYRLEGELDLHGLTEAAALEQLQQFLQYARRANLRCLRIIHGKGLRSGQRGPVLKQAVNAYLRRSDAVLAFASARPVDGGTGATLVLLSRSR